MPRLRGLGGRSADPQQPCRCPICGDVVGYRGRRQHLRACLARHNRPLSEVEAVMRAFLPLSSPEAPNFEAWATRALDLRRRLDDLSKLKLKPAARESLRKRWELELGELETRLNGS